MSDIHPHSRSDLVELPCDSEAHIHLWGYDNGRQCWCGERKPAAVSVLDYIRARSDLHARLRESVRMLDGASNVVELAAVRARRRK